MNMTSQSKTIMFADIASSTRLYQSLGDKRAKETIDTCMKILSQVILKYQGLIVKTIGDEVMSTFDKPDHAILAAIEMNNEIENRVELFSLEDFHLNVYTGIHHGPVIEDQGDFFGDAVNIAARMVKLAKQRQIIASFDTFKTLQPHTQQNLRALGKVRVKGISEEIAIYEVVWEQDEMTLIMNTSELSRSVDVSLDVRFGEQVFRLGDDNPSLTIGRQDFNDVVIDENFISRAHAVIDFRKNNFVLVDKSSNGTYVRISGDRIVKILKDEVPLNDEGVISAGDKTFKKADLIYYKMIRHISE